MEWGLVLPNDKKHMKNTAIHFKYGPRGLSNPVVDAGVVVTNRSCSLLIAVESAILFALSSKISKMKKKEQK